MTLMFNELWLLKQIKDMGVSQEEVIKTGEEYIKEMLHPYIQEGKTLLLNEIPDEVADAFQLKGILSKQTYNISPSLARVLSKTKTPTKMMFVHKKAMSYITKNAPIKTDKGIVYFMPINHPKGFGTFMFNSHFMGLIITKNFKLNFNVTIVPTNNPNLELEEEVEKLNKEAPKGLIEGLFRAFSYIVCSGQPDLREVTQGVRTLNSKKKIKHADKFSHHILPRVDVGLGFEKTPMYKTNEWLRVGHFRHQPYGPKDNPTHYELIWINNTTVKRKKLYPQHV